MSVFLCYQLNDLSGRMCYDVYIEKLVTKLNFKQDMKKSGENIEIEMRTPPMTKVHNYNLNVIR